MISSGPKEISDGTISFREITPEDSELLYGWRFLHSPTRSMFRTTDMVGRDQHQRLLEQYFDPKNTDRWFIAERDGVPVGTISLVGMSEDGKEYETGRLIIDPGRRGENLGFRTLALILEYSRALGLRRVRGEVFESNEVQRRNLRELGYRETGSYEHSGRRFLKVVRDFDESND